MKRFTFFLLLILSINCGGFLLNKSEKKSNSFFLRIFSLFSMNQSSEVAKNDASVGVEEFSVLHTIPGNEEEKININQPITITFSHEIDSSTVNASSFVVSENDRIVSGTISSAENVIIFIPNNKFYYNTVYKITLGTEIKSKQGKYLKNNYSFKFNTVGFESNTPLLVQSFFPEENSLQAPTNQKITFNFSNEIDPQSINANSFAVLQDHYPIVGVINVNEKEISFQPTLDLPTSSVITVVLSETIQDLAKNKLQSEFRIHFITKDPSSLSIVSTSPVHNGTAFWYEKINVKFSGYIDSSTLSTDRFYVSLDGEKITGTVGISASPDTIEFIPDTPFQMNKTYTVSVKKGIMDFFSNTIASDYTFVFTSPEIQLDNIVQIVAGTFHSCAVFASGKAKCWGTNNFGQLGYPTKTIEPDAIHSEFIELNEPIQSISLGIAHTCALLNSGRIRCWGSNGRGQLGLGERTGSVLDPKIAPNVPLDTGAIQITTGSFHTCALLSTKKVRCWGDGSSHQLRNRDQYGDLLSRESIFNAYLAKDIWLSTQGDLVNIKSISAGSNFSCAKDEDYTYCWGDNSKSQLGYENRFLTSYKRDGGSIYYHNDQAKYSKISVGFDHTCGILQLDTGSFPDCWGANDFGKLGIKWWEPGWFGPQETAIFNWDINITAPSTSRRVLEISAGKSHTCIIESHNKGIKCWGSNEKSQLGFPSAIGKTMYDVSPLFVPNVEIGTINTTITPEIYPVSISAGYEHTCALFNNGTAQCWGGNSFQQLGYSNLARGVSLVPPRWYPIYGKK